MENDNEPNFADEINNDKYAYIFLLVPIIIITIFILFSPEKASPKYSENIKVISDTVYRSDSFNLMRYIIDNDTIYHVMENHK